MKKCFPVYATFCTTLLLLTFVPRYARQPRHIDTRNWRLTEFIDHLRSSGLAFHVVPVGDSGKLGNTVYLTEDPEATWQSFQTKIRNSKHIEQWQGAVWVEYLPSEDYGEWYVVDWGSYGCQIDRFAVFGDSRLVEQIRKAFNR